MTIQQNKTLNADKPTASLSGKLSKDRNTLAFGGVAIALLVAGPLVPSWLLFLMTIAMAKALVVIGLVILMRAGLVSFGQGLYYCLGAYTVGLVGEMSGFSDILVLLTLAVVVSVVTGTILGLLLSGYRQIFFAMLSLALSMILYGVLVKTQALGSTDGFNIVPASLFGWTPEAGTGGLMVYSVAIVFVLAVAILVQRYFASPLGFVSEAIRENEIRVEYLGAWVRRAICIKYVAAAGLAGLGGAINAFAAGHIDPELAYRTTSGEFVFIALMGGVAHVAAPLIASVLFELIRTYAFELSPHTWQMILGATLLLIIIFLPKGLWSLVRRWQRGGSQ